MINVAKQYLDVGHESVVKVKDTIFPSVYEIYKFIKKSKLQKKDFVICKLLMDMYECICDRKEVFELVCPASIKLYKSMSDDDLTFIFNQVTQIELRIQDKGYSYPQCDS